MYYFRPIKRCIFYPDEIVFFYSISSEVDGDLELRLQPFHLRLLSAVPLDYFALDQCYMPELESD